MVVKIPEISVRKVMQFSQTITRYFSVKSLSSAEALCSTPSEIEREA